MCLCVCVQCLEWPSPKWPTLCGVDVKPYSLTHSCDDQLLTVQLHCTEMHQHCHLHWWHISNNSSSCSSSSYVVLAWMVMVTDPPHSLIDGQQISNRHKHSCHLTTGNSSTLCPKKGSPTDISSCNWKKDYRILTIFWYKYSWHSGH